MDELQTLGGDTTWPSAKKNIEDNHRKRYKKILVDTETIIKITRERATKRQRSNLPPCKLVNIVNNFTGHLSHPFAKSHSPSKTK